MFFKNYFRNILILYVFLVNLVYILQVVVQSIEKADDDAAIKVLIELTESAPKFLRPQVETIFQVCMKVSKILYIIKTNLFLT